MKAVNTRVSTFFCEGENGSLLGFCFAATKSFQAKKGNRFEDISLMRKNTAVIIIYFPFGTKEK